MISDKVIKGYLYDLRNLVIVVGAVGQGSFANMKIANTGLKINEWKKSPNLTFVISHEIASVGACQQLSNVRSRILYMYF